MLCMPDDRAWVSNSNWLSGHIVTKKMLYVPQIKGKRLCSLCNNTVKTSIEMKHDLSLYLLELLNLQIANYCLKPLKISKSATQAQLYSILASFYEQLLRRYSFDKKSQSPTIIREKLPKHFCTKNVLVKCWWNWRL